jgi:hypothetical protein
MESPFVLMLLLQVHTCCPRLWHQLTVFEVAKSHSGYSTSSSTTTIGLQQTRAIVVCRGLRTYGFSDLVAFFLVWFVGCLLYRWLIQRKEVCFIIVHLIESGGSFGLWGFWLLQRSVESGSRRSGLFDVSNNTGHWILQRVRQYATVQAAATAKNDTTATTGRTAPIPPPSRVNVSPHGLSPPIVHRSVQWEFVLSISTEVDCLFSLRIYLGFFTLFHKFCFSGSDHGVLRQKTVDFARTPPHPVFCQ